MTKGERVELERIIKGRRRVATKAIEERKADLLADVEQRLACIYRFDDASWASVTAAAKKAVEDADAIVAEKCRELGIPEQFRPSLDLSWYGRGESASKERRTIPYGCTSKRWDLFLFSPGKKKLRSLSVSKRRRFRSDATSTFIGWKVPTTASLSSTFWM